MPARRRDAGVNHALEVSLAAIFMVSGVALVSTFTIDNVSHYHRMEPLLEQRASDLLLVARDHTLGDGDCGARNKLDQLVIDGLTGEKQNWTEWRAKFFDQGFDVNMYLDNFHGLLELHEPTDAVGITSTVRYFDEFSYTLPVPAVSAVSGLEDLPIDVPTIRDSQLQRARGEAVEFRTHLGNELTNAERSVWGLTAMLPNTAPSDTRAFAQNISWSDGAGPLLLVELSPEEALGEELVRFRVHVEAGRAPHGGGQTIPAGTTIQISFPPGWSEISDASEDWHLEVGDDDNRPRGVATLLTTASDSTLELRAYAPQTTRPFDVIHARLGGGSLGESSLVVKYPVTAGTQRDLPRTFHPTLPYPVRNESWALYGLAFANGGDKVKVTQIDIRIPGGYDVAMHDGVGAPLFAAADATGFSNPGGSWTRINERLVRWEGVHEVDALGMASWVVGIRMNANPSAATSVEGPTSEGPVAKLTFTNGFETTSTRWGRSPGIPAFRVPPESVNALDGYETFLGIHEIVGRGQDRFGAIEGLSQYRSIPTSADVASMQHALANSTLEPRERLVRAGSVAHVTADLDSIATTLGQLGVIDPKLTFTVHAPLTRGCPTYTRVTQLSALPATSISDVLLWDGGLGLPVAFAYVSDAKVYHIAATGLHAWSVDVGAANGKLAGGYDGTLHTLFVGTAAGRVLGLDPATGMERWSQTLQGSDPGVTSLFYDEPRRRVVVGTASGGLVVLDATDGGASLYADTHGTAPFTQIEVAADGTIYAGSDRGVTRLSSDLSLSNTGTFSSGVLGFSVAPDRLIVGYAQTYDERDPATLALIVTRNMVERAVLATGEDANGDGAMDLVLAFDNNKLRIVDGATGWLTWQGYSPQTIPIHGEIFIHEGPPELHCRGRGGLRSYVPPLTCGMDAGSAGPTHLAARPSQTSLAYVSFGEVGAPGAWIVGTDGDGASWTGEPREPISAIALGNWGATRAMVVGTSTGVIRVVDVDAVNGPATVATSTPGSRLGLATFFLEIPEGAIIGTYLVKATISWLDATSKPITASMVDWFEVVGPTGAHTTRPAYDIGIMVHDRGMP